MNSEVTDIWSALRTLRRRERVDARAVQGPHPGRSTEQTARSGEGLSRALRLTPAQMRIASLCTDATNSLQYQRTAGFLLGRGLDRERLARAVEALGRRHPILSCRLVRPPQTEQRAHTTLAAADAAPSLHASSPARLERSESGGGLFPQVREWCRRPLEPEVALFRAVLLQTDRGRSLLLLCVHQLICDAHAEDILVRDLGELYREDLCDVAGRAANSGRAQGASGPAEQFPSLPIHGTPASNVPRTEDILLHSNLTPELTRTLQSRCVAWDVSPFGLIFAACQSAFGLVGLRRRAAFFTTTAGRHQVQSRETVNLLAHLHPIPDAIVGPDPPGSLRAFLRKIRQTTLDLLARQDRTTAGPFFESESFTRMHRPLGVLIVHRAGLRPPLDLGLVPTRRLRIGPAAAQFDVTVVSEPTKAGGLRLTLLVRRGILPSSLIRRFARNLRAVLRRAAVRGDFPWAADRLPPDLLAGPWRAEQARPEDGSPPAQSAPSATRTQELVAQIWQRVLGRQVGDVHAHFGSLGGDSLRALHAVLEIERVFGCALPSTCLLTHPTVAELAEFLDRTGHTTGLPAAEGPLQLLARGGSLDGLFCFPPQDGSPWSLLPLAQALGSERPVYAFDLESPHNNLSDSEALPQLAARCVSLIREVQVEGPYFLAGVCTGATLAHAVAHEFERQGQTTAFVGLLLATPPTLRGRSRHYMSAVPRYLFRPGTAPLLFIKLWHHIRLRLSLRLGRLRPFRRTWNRLDALLRTYEPQRTQADLTLFLSEEKDRMFPHYPREWRGLTRGQLHYHVIQGHHYNALRGKRLSSVASLLNECLRHTGTFGGRTKGRWICVTGADGCGKTTVITAVAGRLAALGVRCTTVSVWDALPYEGLAGKAAVQEHVGALPPRERAAFVLNLYARALRLAEEREEQVVLVSGHWYKYFANERARGIPPHVLEPLVRNLREPDLVFLLEATVELTVERKETVSPYESNFAPPDQRVARFRELQKQTIAELQGLADRYGWERLDARASVEELAEQVLARVHRPVSQVLRVNLHSQAPRPDGTAPITS